MSGRSALSDLFDVGKLVAKGLVGELSDSDLRRRDTEPAPPPDEVEEVAATAGDPNCPRCAGVGYVLLRHPNITGPCPRCIPGKPR